MWTYLAKEGVVKTSGAYCYAAFESVAILQVNGL